ncbi:MAG: tetratricopeptide repeat protein [Pyrinomonadaceae bacterium]|nr:tetratricopeptide repeat protein [Pyrinomonadaceae bacterium]
MAKSGHKQWFLSAQQSAMLLLAIAFCNTVISAQQTNSFNHAVSLFKKGSYAEAAEALAAIVKDDSTSVAAHLYLGKTLINLQRFSEAETALRRYTAARPASDEGLYLLAYVLFREGRAKESLTIYTQAVKLKPPTSDDLKIVGLNYGLLNNLERSADYLKRALDADPNNLEALYYLGRVRYTENHFGEATRIFQEILKRDSQHIKALNNLGQALEAQNNLEEATAAYRRAIELDRNSAKPSELPLLNLGLLLLQNNQIEEAIALLTRAAEANPRSAQVKFHLGKAYMRLERLSDAERELVAATQLAPQDVGAHYQLGRLYYRLKKTDLARREMEISEQLRTKGRH